MRERPILFSAPMVRAILSGAKTQTRRLVKPRHILNAGKPGDVEALSRLAHEYGDPIKSNEYGVSFDCDGVRGVVSVPMICPYGAVGDQLWVRETWYCDNFTERDFEAARVGHVTPRTDAEIIAEWRESLYYRADTASGRGSCCELIPECMCAEYKTASGRRRSPWKPGIHMPRWASRITLEVTGVRVERLHAITASEAVAEGVIDDAHGWDGNPTYPLARFRSLWREINGAESWDANPWVWCVTFRRLTDAVA